MRKLVLLYKYCIYWLKSTNEHGVHSPFVFYLVTQIIYNNKDYYIYKAIEALREKLVHSANPEVGRFTKELLPAKYDQLLFRLVNYFQPENVLVVGHSPCVDAIYAASANSKTKVVVVLQSQTSNDILQENIKQLKLENVVLQKRNVADVLNDYLKIYKVSDFVIIQAENKIGMLNAFYQYLETISESSVLVISGLHKSSEMQEVWDAIKANDKVKVTIDLFYLGIVFFRKEQVKEHFLIRF